MQRRRRNSKWGGGGFPRPCGRMGEAFYDATAGVRAKRRKLGTHAIKINITRRMRVVAAALFSLSPSQRVLYPRTSIRSLNIDRDLGLAQLDPTHKLLHSSHRRQTPISEISSMLLHTDIKVSLSHISLHIHTRTWTETHSKKP